MIYYPMMDRQPKSKLYLLLRYVFHSSKLQWQQNNNIHFHLSRVTTLEKLLLQQQEIVDVDSIRVAMIAGNLDDHFAMANIWHYQLSIRIRGYNNKQRQFVFCCCYIKFVMNFKRITKWSITNLKYLAIERILFCDRTCFRLDVTKSACVCVCVDNIIANWIHYLFRGFSGI